MAPGALAFGIARPRRSPPGGGEPYSPKLLKKVATTLITEIQHRKAEPGGKEWKAECVRLLRVARFALHLGHTATVSDCVSSLLHACVMDDTGTDPDQDLRLWTKKKRRAALEVKCKSTFAQWLMWQPLVDRQPTRERERSPALLDAYQRSVDYEDILRETSETSEDDARDRSCALTLRARSLYLQGQFRQAHHFLDLAPAGLRPGRVDHRTSLAVVHLFRAELLTLSADHHYNDVVACRRRAAQSDSQPQVPENTQALLDAIASARKKIDRAEAELDQAETALRGMTHQNLWRVRLDFGWGQVCLERMLFEVEELFWNRGPLPAPEYLRRSGRHEKTILEGLRRLRSVLDVLPFRASCWKREKKAQGAQLAPIIVVERMMYRVWRQLFVVGAYNAAILSHRHFLDTGPGEETPSQIQRRFASLTGIATGGADAAAYRERWKLWCNAMRFDQFAAEQIQFPETPPAEGGAQVPAISIREMVVEVMLQASTEESINRMWDLRRGPSDGKHRATG